MSRSRRKPCFFHCAGADPKTGKAVTSRSVRRGVKAAIAALDGDEDLDFVRADDKNRGRAGSRSADFGWDYFGDGKLGPWDMDGWFRPESVAKLSRK